MRSKPPKGVEVEVDDEGLDLHITWRTQVSMLVGVQYLAWAVAGTIAVTVLVLMGEALGLLLLLSPLFVAGGYGCVALVVNRTTVAIRDLGVDVRHGPLPWWGGGTFLARDLRSLLVDVDATFGRSRVGERPPVVYRYALEGRRGRLLAGWPRREPLDFVKDQLEAFFPQDAPQQESP